MVKILKELKCKITTVKEKYLMYLFISVYDWPVYKLV